MSGARQSVQVYTMYTPKSKKVLPVDFGYEKGEKPGGREDWYERAKLRESPQEQVGKYKDHLIPRFCDIPRGSRLTPERLKKLDVGEEITTEERVFFEEMMLNREKAMAFDWKECGKVHEDVTPPIVIKTVEHKAWQSPGFPLPRVLREQMLEMLRDRLAKGVLERCFGPYRNPWFLVAKKQKGQYRLVNACMEMNRYTIRDANLPPSVDEFSEEFAGCQVSSLIDWFSGYDQLVLAEESRDMTAFMTPLGLLRMTTVPQGATNSIAQFVRVVEKILEPLLNHVAMPFMDDVGVKGPYTDYDNEEILPGIRRFVYEHIQNLDKTLERVERAGVSIGPKSQFMKKGMTIVGFSTGSFGRLPEVTKVIKILEWPSCNCVSDARAFLGVCVFYRIWVRDFAQLAEPIYKLTHKGVPWKWTDEQEEAMNALKNALTAPPALCRISYDEGAGEIVIGVDASLSGWGATMGQRDENKKMRVARYESGVWNRTEQNYDATKRETRAVLKALRKLRFYLYGVHFVLETDAKVLVDQMKRTATDLPGSLVTRWIACIRMFDFEVRHVPGKTHTAADGLSRRLASKAEREEEAMEGDIDDWPDEVLFDDGPLEFGVNHMSAQHRNEQGDARSNYSLSHRFEPLNVCPMDIDMDDAESENEVPVGVRGDVLEAGYSEESIRIATFLTTLQKPAGMDGKEYRNFKKKALHYTVLDR
jgi:ribonuclease HI